MCVSDWWDPSTLTLERYFLFCLLSGRDLTWWDEKDGKQKTLRFFFYLFPPSEKNKKNLVAPYWTSSPYLGQLIRICTHPPWNFFFKDFHLKCSGVCFLSVSKTFNFKFFCFLPVNTRHVIHLKLCSLCVYRLRDEIKRRTVYESLQGTLLDICYFFMNIIPKRFKGAGGRRRKKYLEHPERATCNRN